MSTVIIETPRLRIRRLEPEDASALFAVYGDAEAMRWVDDGQPLPLAECERWIEVTHGNYATRGYGMFAMVERTSGNVVGFCGLVHPQEQAETELKYALRRDSWGRGLAAEAARAMLQYAELSLGIKHVIATAAPENAASHRVLIKAGMRSVGLRKDVDGTYVQHFEWRADPRVAEY